MGWLAEMFGKTLPAPFSDDQDTQEFINRKIPIERIDFHIKRYRQAILRCKQDAKLDALLTSLSYWTDMRSKHDTQ